MYTQNNSMALRELLGKDIGAKIQHEKYFDFIHATTSCWPKIMFNLRLEKAEIPDFIQIIEKGIQSGYLPETFVTDIADQGNEILNKLEKLDFRTRHWTVMRHDLKELSPLDLPENLEVVRVQSEKQLEVWSTICETELMKGKMDQRMFRDKLKDKNLLLFLGQLNGKPISTAMVYIQNLSSGLYFIATENQFRGKGYAKAITRHSLWEAQKRGCNSMDLEATDDGFPVYKNVGFQNCGRLLLINFAKKKDEI